MARYANAVHWIAENDECAEDDWRVIADLISVSLTADLFNRHEVDVAKDVVRVRHCRRHGTIGKLPKRLAV